MKSSFYGRHVLVKAAIVCVEGVRKKIQEEKLADALPERICCKDSSSSPGCAEEPLAHTALLMQHLGNWWTRAGHQLLLQLLIMAVRDVLLNRWGSSFLGRKAAWCCRLLLQPTGDVEWKYQGVCSSEKYQWVCCFFFWDSQSSLHAVAMPTAAWKASFPWAHTQGAEHLCAGLLTSSPEDGSTPTSLKSAGRGCF